MSLNEFLPPVLLAAAITFFLRALPFLIFHGEKRMPGWLERLGQALPSAPPMGTIFKGSLPKA